MPLQLIRNDLTKMRVDAIVNAANPSLLGGGGVDGAIHRAAGPRLLAACRRLGGCPVGQARLTRGYDLPCKYVIHTVGPIWQGGAHGERAQLASCYRSALALAVSRRCKTVAFPLISSGVYGYPKAQALQVALETIAEFLSGHDMTVYIVVFDRDAVQVSSKLFQNITAYIDDVYADAHADPAGRFRQLPAAPVGGFAEEAASFAPPPRTAMRPSVAHPGLDAMLAQLDESFTQMLLRLIDEKHISDADCYKKANIDRRLFHKIRSNPHYKPSKQTALALAVALELSLEQTRELLMKAGFALSHSDKGDIVVEYCIRQRIYNIIEINQVLFKLDLQPLGY